ncbi:hypothetical protein SAMN04487969_12218 [Paenibacillus algorifonticola]|uniref:Uncharacterized protein n=1 Tax=Paenibacillus algorifonticola TaxID=684063 RepID=A0A1I2HDJ7_9BACL|nr:hypothetical protein SAMN04487969_12218 [Paenibacillus algorifonticola]
MIPASITNAANSKPEDLFKKKFPKEKISVSKSGDLNNDKKAEHFILAESGNFYFINTKGAIELITTGIISDEDFASPTIQIFSVTKTEKHVAVAYEYFPSNTRMEVFRLKKASLESVLDIMGDQGVTINKKGQVTQLWKKYNNEGWSLAAAVYTWNSKTATYKGSGQLP